MCMEEEETETEGFVISKSDIRFRCDVRVLQTQRIN